MTKKLLLWLTGGLVGAGSLLYGLWLMMPAVAFITFGIMIITLVVGAAYEPSNSSNS